jgi:hypothetical protein
MWGRLPLGFRRAQLGSWARYNNFYPSLSTWLGKGTLQPCRTELMLELCEGDILMKTPASNRTWNRLIVEMLVAIERNRIVKELRRLRVEI